MPRGRGRLQHQPGHRTRSRTPATDLRTHLPTDHPTRSHSACAMSRNRFHHVRRGGTVCRDGTRHVPGAVASSGLTRKPARPNGIIRNNQPPDVAANKGAPVGCRRDCSIFGPGGCAAPDSGVNGPVVITLRCTPECGAADPSGTG
jgi:hypothetical protein